MGNLISMYVCVDAYIYLCVCVCVSTIYESNFRYIGLTHSQRSSYLSVLFQLCLPFFFLGDLLVNPDQPRQTIPIAQIAPDLILADLPRNIMLNNDDLEFDEAPEFLLGKNYFCRVRGFLHRLCNIWEAF